MVNASYAIVWPCNVVEIGSEMVVRLLLQGEWREWMELLQGLGFSGFLEGQADCRGVSDGVLQIDLMSVGG